MSLIKPKVVLGTLQVIRLVVPVSLKTLLKLRWCQSAQAQLCAERVHDNLELPANTKSTKKYTYFKDVPCDSVCEIRGCVALTGDLLKCLDCCWCVFDLKPFCLNSSLDGGHKCHW